MAAAMNAGSSVLQRLATGKPTARTLFSGRFTARVTLSRLFLLGVGLQVGAFLCQALALGNGPLVLVEPLLMTDLVFLLVFIYLKTGVKTSWQDWLAVGAIVVGLSVLFMAASPQGGHLKYVAMPWIITVGAIACFIGLVIVAVRRIRSPHLRGVLAALAAAGSFALTAAFTKLALNQWQTDGVAAMFTSWPLYALAVVGLSSIYLLQNAYGSGPLAITQPTMEITEPAISVVIGIAIFGDSVHHSLPALVIESVGAGLVIWGIFWLTASPNIQRAGKKGM